VDRADCEWFYIEADGSLYGSELAPEELKKIAQMGTVDEIAIGIELVLYPFANESLKNGDVEKLKARLKNGPVLAKLIRQPEALRLEAKKKLSDLQKFLEEVGDNSFLKSKEKEDIQTFPWKANSALRDEDFKKSLELVKEGLEKAKELQKLFEKRAECAKKAQQAITEHYSHCPLCGKEMDNECTDSSHDPESVEFPEYDEEGY